MTIQFTDLKIKAAPAGNQGLNVSLAENDPNIINPVEQEGISLNYATLSPGDKAIVDSFITLLKSKL